MAEIDLTQINIFAEAEQGFRIFSDRLEQFLEEPVDLVDSIITFIRTIPAEEMTKKRELARFFNSEAGSKYSSDERKAAYDRLLGAERNAKLRG